VEKKKLPISLFHLCISVSNLCISPKEIGKWKRDLPIPSGEIGISFTEIPISASDSWTAPAK